MDDIKKALVKAGKREQRAFIVYVWTAVWQAQDFQPDGYVVAGTDLRNLCAVKGKELRGLVVSAYDDLTQLCPHPWDHQYGDITVVRALLGIHQ